SRLGTCGEAGLAFLVHSARLGRGPAQRMQRFHRDLEHLLAAADLEFVADLDLARRLDGIAVPLDVAGVYGLAGQAARLEEAGGPEPGVDSLFAFYHGRILSHARPDGPDRVRGPAPSGQNQRRQLRAPQRLSTTCNATATAPTMKTTSPMVRIQRSVCKKSCCMKASLRAYHKPSLTLAWNWKKPMGSRLVKIISKRPIFSVQKPVFISFSQNTPSGRM